MSTDVSVLDIVTAEGAAEKWDGYQTRQDMWWIENGLGHILKIIPKLSIHAISSLIRFDSALFVSNFKYKMKRTRK